MIKWDLDPFQYCVINNFLSNDDFEKLKEELKNTDNFLQTSFNTPLEKKSIYKDKNLKSEANKVIKIMASKRIKDIIAEYFVMFLISIIFDFVNYKYFGANKTHKHNIFNQLLTMGHKKIFQFCFPKNNVLIVRDNGRYYK